MKLCFIKIFFTVLASLYSTVCLAFQFFPENKRINPAYKDFKYYISSTYYNFSDDDQAEITNIHVQGVKKSLAILTEKAAAAGVALSFEYAGTFDQPTFKKQQEAGTLDDTFHKTIYFDFTSNELWGRAGVASAVGIGMKSTQSGEKNAGGLVKLNSDYINFIHPKSNLSLFVIHEFLHILGLDHSTVSSSIMAYTEFWYPTLSADDVLGLQNIYGVGPSTTLTVAASLSGAAAKGIEIVAINVATGVSHVGLTDENGTLTVKHIPLGTYMIGSRELTPTGPCFTKPTQGFLSSFYVANGSSTNTPSQATQLTFSEGSSHAINLALIAGKKRFDCHYGDAVALSSEACNSDFFGSPTFQEKCYLHMTTAGIRFPLLGENDKSILSHKTDTDPNSQAYTNVVYQSMGTNPGLVFHSYAPLADWRNKNYIDLDVLPTAAIGTHAALCTEGGESALVSSFIEVQEFGGSLNNSRLLPDLVGEMDAYASMPTNFGEFIRPGDSQPGIGNRPSNVSDDKPKKKKKWYECGAIALESKNSQKSATVILALPLLLILVRRKNRCV